MKALMHILAGLALIVLALSFILVYTNTHPPRYPLHIPPSEYRVPYEEVSFTSVDGTLLRGWFIRPERISTPLPAVVLCHGLGANKSDFTGLGAALFRRGYAVLLFDFRAHGESGGSRTSLGLYEQDDVRAAVRYLAARPEVEPQRIALYGFSLGGSAAILAAAGNPAVRAVVADSAFTSLRDQARTAITGFYHLPAFPVLPLALWSYGLSFQASADAVSPVSAIVGIAPVPVLIIAGEGDALIPAENGRKLYAAAKEPKELWIIEHADHGGTLAAAGDDYERRVIGFFDRVLK
jgi:fermentation-respiration switch protein FrsA (DUF1100 family)